LLDGRVWTQFKKAQKIPQRRRRHTLAIYCLNGISKGTVINGRETRTGRQWARVLRKDAVRRP